MRLEYASDKLTLFSLRIVQYDKYAFLSAAKMIFCIYVISISNNLKLLTQQTTLHLGGG